MKSVFIAILTASIFLLFLPCNFGTPDSCKHISPFIYVCPNGTILRDTTTVPLDPVPPCPNRDPATGVASKDILINPLTKLSVRVYLPYVPNPTTRIPILVYFHGGAFCIGGPSSRLDHLYLNKVASTAKVLIVSVGYRKFPEYEIPVPFDDSWATLRWLASLKVIGFDPWITSQGDFDKVFIGGESAGATIVHFLSLRAGFMALPHGVTITGAFLAMPYFLNSTLLPSEPKDFQQQSFYQVWDYVCPRCNAGVDSSYINPYGLGRMMTLIGIDKMMVYVGEKDYLKQRGIAYEDMVRSSGWDGELQTYEAPGEDHVFHVLKPNSTNTKILIDRLAAFLNA